MCVLCFFLFIMICFQNTLTIVIEIPIPQPPNDKCRILFCELVVMAVVAQCLFLSPKTL